MGQKYLLLGASSDLCATFLRHHEWEAEDEIIAQYFRHKEDLEAIKQDIPAAMELWPADFSDAKSTEKFAADLRGRNFVPTHILHVPAVPIDNMRFTEITWEDARRQMDVQCRSLWMILQAILKPMAKAKTGKIIIVLSSCSMNVPPKFLSGYVMAKYALMGMGKALAVEYAPKGIQVNMVSPSMMETKFLENVYGDVVKQSAANNPAKRNAKPEDVVGLIEFLFSSQNTFITGANIPVAGGEAF